MTRVQAIIPALLLALTIGTSSAYAHARLDHASPAVGSTVASSPGEVVLYFTENLEGKFSSADVQSSSGARMTSGQQCVWKYNSHQRQGSFTGILRRSLARPVRGHAQDPRQLQLSRWALADYEGRSGWTTPWYRHRAAHFAATISAAGVVFFCAWGVGLVIDPPAGQVADRRLEDMRRRLRLIFWLSLGLAFASGVVWLCMTAAAIDDISLFEIFNDGDFWAVATGTQFGRTSLVRLMLGSLLAASVWYSGLGARPGDHSYAQLALGVAFLGSVAWLGHAAATPGFLGGIHLVADILHLTAVGAWVGGLLPFAIFLATFRRPEILGRVVTIVTVTKRSRRSGLPRSARLWSPGL